MINLPESEQLFIQSVISLLKDYPEVKYKIDPKAGKVTITVSDQELEKQLEQAILELVKLWDVNDDHKNV